jgi:hypothetical protein
MAMGARNHRPDMRHLALAANPVFFSDLKL